MMPPVYSLVAILLLLFSDSHPREKPQRVYATCYGYTPCAACTSCRYCKRCTSGGTCGTCKPAKKEVAQKEQPTSKPVPVTQTKEITSNGQCKAITKKGTRCSRSVRSKGYCWQHGG